MDSHDEAMNAENTPGQPASPSRVPLPHSPTLQRMANFQTDDILRALSTTVGDLSAIVSAQKVQTTQNIAQLTQMFAHLRGLELHLLHDDLNFLGNPRVSMGPRMYVGGCGLWD